MSLSDIMLGRRSSDDLGAFDANEATDLPLHVRQCGRRYRALDRKLDWIIRLIVVFFLAMVLNVPGGLKTLVALIQ